MQLPEDIARRLEVEFSGTELTEAVDVVSTIEGDRLRRAVVFLGRGELSVLREMAKAAGRDSRDVLWWAEYDHPAEPERRIRSMSEPFRDR